MAVPLSVLLEGFSDYLDVSLFRSVPSSSTTAANHGSKLLKYKENDMMRFLMPDANMCMKVVGNFYVENDLGFCELQPNTDGGQMWVWQAKDFSDGKERLEQLASVFASGESCTTESHMKAFVS